MKHFITSLIFVLLTTLKSFAGSTTCEVCNGRTNFSPGNLIHLCFQIEGNGTPALSWYLSKDTLWDVNDQLMSAYRPSSNQEWIMDYRINCDQYPLGPQYIFHLVNGQVVNRDSINMTKPWSCGIDINVSQTAGSQRLSGLKASFQLRSHYYEAISNQSLKFFLSPDLKYDYSDFNLSIDSNTTYTIPANFNGKQNYSFTDINLSMFGYVPDGIYYLGMKIYGKYQGELNGIPEYITFDVTPIQYGTVTSSFKIASKDNRNVIARYNILGQPVNDSQKGLVFERYTDGSIRKVFIQ